MTLYPSRTDDELPCGSGAAMNEQFELRRLNSFFPSYTIDELNFPSQFTLGTADERRQAGKSVGWIDRDAQ